MQTEFKQVNATTKEVILTVETERVDAAHQKYQLKAAKYLEVPGFRKGKAPLNMITRMYGEKIKDNFEKDFVDEVFSEAAREHEIHFLLYPEVKEIEWQPGSEMKITLEVEHEPPVEFKQLEGLQVPFLPADLEAETEKLIQNLAQENSTIQDVDVANEGDTVRGHLSFEWEGRHITREAEFIVKSPASDKFPEGLVGASTGKRFEAELKGGEVRDAHDAVLEREIDIDIDLGASYACSLEVSSITRKVVPALDDEFARDMDFADMQEMRAKVAEDLRPRLQHHNYDGENSAILGKLFKDNQFPLPSKTLRYIVEQELNNYDPKFHQVLQSYVIEKVVHDMTSMYLLSALQKRSGLEVTDEMVDVYVEHKAILQEMNPAAYREEHAEAIASEDFREGALNYHILRGIAANSEFVEPEPEPEQPVEPEPEVSEETGEEEA